MKRKASFASGIIRNIKTIFGLAFFVMCIGSGVLLFITEDDKDVMLIKIVSTLVAYVALYLLSVITVSNNIRKQFAPLDKLARGLKDNSIDIIGDNDDIKTFAMQLKADIEKLDSLDSELKETRSNLDDAYIQNEKAISGVIDSIDDCKKTLAKFTKREKKVKERLINTSNHIDEIMNEFNRIKGSHKELAMNSELLSANIHSNLNKQEEIKEDYDKVKEAHQGLNNTLNESVTLLDSLFSEISVLQNIASQVNLYAMNTSIEASRNGIFNININNALDELKELSVKIQNKSDELALLSIRSKNSLNLAIENSEFCMEENNNNIGELTESIERLDALNGTVKTTLEYTESILDCASVIKRKLQEIDEDNSEIIIDSDYVLDSISGLGKQLFEIDKSLKNNDI